MAQISYTEYEARATASRADWKRWQALLEIDELGRLAKKKRAELDAKADDDILIASAAFGDGTKIDLHLRSGTENYHVDAEVMLPDGTVLADPPEPGFDLDTEYRVMIPSRRAMYGFLFEIAA